MGDYPYYNPSLDTVRLELADDDKLRDLASIDFEIRSMGIPFHLIDGEVWRAIGADIRHFHSLREIVFVLGRTRANCEMELVYVDENSPEVTQRYPHNPNGRAGVREFVRAFKAELASRHKKWELNQCRRADKSKSTKHWNLPEVKVAFLKALCTSTSPYSYVNRFPERADFPEELPWGDIH
ncbi:hypothetical protein GLAREA_11920 [Glarea lozoyensis ATCC 20868]|uniref:Uncharacterized protein n=1 Tax=Glarea lozoyensis (strain ATCC 20868 / MF5171) TaxID=1116229 RepID=S3DZW7_GLAL2|nr:uncharacterized protein GLAREA_11920 [Glarea lozoyensis ATCC 20868]EPE31838.1 hypothetical protein GLAREA_11920 [Glarea lozoyensis ATCC 20868]